jgi:hypothetical protein
VAVSNQVLHNAVTDTATALPPIPITGSYRLFSPLVVTNYSADPDVDSYSDDNSPNGQGYRITFRQLAAEEVQAAKLPWPSDKRSQWFQVSMFTPDGTLAMKAFVLVTP